jgi:hypothetical protein
MTIGVGEKCKARLARLFRPAVLIFLLLAAQFFSAAAEKPTLEHIHPVAVARGTTNSISFSGKFKPWPPKEWVQGQGLEFHFETNSGRASITVATNADVGPTLVRLYNEEGASDPIIMVVSDRELSTEVEPNNFFAKPQVLTHFPCSIRGRLDKNNDVDSFAVRVKAGDWLDARMESYMLMSKIDGVLRLVTTNGYQLAWNHDFSSLDPRLIWQAPRDETVVLQAFGFIYPANAEIALSGGNGGIYLLHLSLSNKPPADLSRPACEEINSAALPLEVYGSICPAGDEDRYVLELKKDEFIEARANATDFGSPLDPWLAIRNSEGKELTRNDDAEGSRDARLEWQVPADGKYTFVIGSLAHQGSENWKYSFQATKVPPDFTAVISENAFSIAPLSTNEVKLTVKRLRGHTNELSLAFEKLPEGVTAEPEIAPAKSGEVKLNLIARDAAPFSGPVRIIVRDKVTSTVKPAQFELVSRSENNGVPGGYSSLLVEQTDQLWLTVKPKKESK